jgi:hypothetical protein
MTLSFLKFNVTVGNYSWMCWNEIWLYICAMVNWYLLWCIWNLDWDVLAVSNLTKWFSWRFHFLTKWLFVMGAVNYHDGLLSGKHVFVMVEIHFRGDDSLSWKYIFMVMTPSWKTIFLWVLEPSRINFMTVTSTKYRHENIPANLMTLYFSWRWPSWNFATKINRDS